MVKILQEKVKTEKVVVAIECDKCHKVYHEKETVEKNGIHMMIECRDTWEISEMHHIDFVGGYGSIFGDGTKVKCDLCQHCLKELIAPFARIEA